MIIPLPSTSPQLYGGSVSDALTVAVMVNNDNVIDNVSITEMSFLFIMLPPIF